MIEVIEIDGGRGLARRRLFTRHWFYLAPGDERAINYLENALGRTRFTCARVARARFVEVKGQRFPGGRNRLRATRRPMEPSRSSAFGQCCRCYRAVRSACHSSPAPSCLRYNEERRPRSLGNSPYITRAPEALCHTIRSSSRRATSFSLMWETPFSRASKAPPMPTAFLGYQSGRFRKQMENGSLLDGGMLNRIILYVTAMMEMKSSMGVIVAAPTAGGLRRAAGAPASARPAAMGLSLDETTKAHACGRHDWRPSSPLMPPLLPKWGGIARPSAGPDRAWAAAALVNAGQGQRGRGRYLPHRWPCRTSSG